jgi:hypothetical protein
MRRQVADPVQWTQAEDGGEKKEDAVCANDADACAMLPIAICTDGACTHSLVQLPRAMTQQHVFDTDVERRNLAAND